MTAGATSSPSAAPATASRPLCTSSSRTMRRREAPSASRSAVSRRRANARARHRFATFKQASSSTRAGRGQQDQQRPLQPPPQIRSPSGRRQDLQRGSQEAALLIGGHARPVFTPRVGLQHRLEPGLKAGLGLRGGHTGLQPAEDVKPAAAPILQPVEVGRRLLLHHGGDPQRRNLSPVDAAKAGRGHADHRHRVVVDQDLAADDVARGCPAGSSSSRRTARRPGALPAARRRTRRSVRPSAGLRRAPRKYEPETISVPTGSGRARRARQLTERRVRARTRRRRPGSRPSGP